MTQSMASTTEAPATTRRLKFTHDHWMASLGLPFHSGYYIEDLRTLELGLVGGARLQTRLHSARRPARHHRDARQRGAGAGRAAARAAGLR